MPLISNIDPIRKVVSMQLRDALDVFRHKSADNFTIQITQLENIGVSPLNIALSLLMVGFGLITYYFIPRAFLLKDNFTFFMSILSVKFMIILGMIFICTQLI